MSGCVSGCVDVSPAGKWGNGAVDRDALARPDNDDVAGVQLRFEEVPCPKKRPPTMASIAGTWNVVPATAGTGPSDNNAYTTIENGATPNVLRIGADGAIQGELSGLQHFPDRYFSFRGASVQGAMRMTGRARPDPKADFSIPIELTAPLTGTSTGAGAVVVDAERGVIDPRPSLSGPVRFPVFTRVRCGNLRANVAETICDSLTFMEGSRERLDLYRAPTRP